MMKKVLRALVVLYFAGSLTAMGALGLMVRNLNSQIEETGRPVTPITEKSAGLKAEESASICKSVAKSMAKVNAAQDEMDRAAQTSGTAAPSERYLIFWYKGDKPLGRIDCVNAARKELSAVKWDRSNEGISCEFADITGEQWFVSIVRYQIACAQADVECILAYYIQATSFQFKLPLPYSANS